MPFIHPEIQVGEVFLGNVTRPFNTTWRTIRYGETAYSGAGSPIGPDWNLVPCFILASEVRRTISAIKINYPNNWRERVATYEAMLKEEYLGDPREPEFETYLCLTSARPRHKPRSGFFNESGGQVWQIKDIKKSERYENTLEVTYFKRKV